MYVRLEYIVRASAIIVKGDSLSNPLAMYRMSPGQSYTALRGINFYLLLQAHEESSGDFVFKVWYKNVSGWGEQTPTKVTWPIPEEEEKVPDDPVPVPDPKENENTEPVETEEKEEKKEETEPVKKPDDE